MVLCKLAVVMAALAALLAGAPTTPAGFDAAFAAKNDTVWSGGDHAASYRAVGGQVYWLFGDTMLGGEDPDGSYADGARMVGNTIVMQRGDELVDAVHGDGPAVPDPPTSTATNQERYWTQAAVQVGGWLYVLCQRVQRDDSQDIGFRLVGVELAKFAIHRGTGRLTLVAMVATPSTGVVEGPGPAHIQWAGDVIARDGYLYVYGYTRALPGNPFVTHHSYVARVPAKQVELPSAWRYYQRSTGAWVPRIADLAADPDVDAVLASQVSSVRVIGGQVVMLHKPWAGLGAEVRAEVGPNPWGPFTSRKVLDSPAGTVDGRVFVTYSPMLHPEQQLAGTDAGRVLVSLSRNGSLADVAADADLYKPQFYAITLP